MKWSSSSSSSSNCSSSSSSSSCCCGGGGSSSSSSCSSGSSSTMGVLIFYRGRLLSGFLLFSVTFLGAYPGISLECRLLIGDCRTGADPRTQLTD